METTARAPERVGSGSGDRSGGSEPPISRAGPVAAWWAAGVLFVLGGVATAIGGWYRWFGGAGLDLIQRQDDGANPFTGSRYVVEGSTQWSVAGWSLIALGMLALAAAIARDRGWGGLKGRTIAVITALTGVFAFASGPLSWWTGQMETPNESISTATMVLSMPWLLGMAPVVLVGVAFSSRRGRMHGPSMGWSLTPLLFSALIVEFLVLITAESVITANPSHDDPMGAGILTGSAVALTGAMLVARLVAVPRAAAEPVAPESPGDPEVALARLRPAVAAAVAFGLLVVSWLAKGIADPESAIEELPQPWLPLGASVVVVTVAWGSLLFWRWGVAGRVLVFVAGVFPVLGEIAWLAAAKSDVVIDTNGFFSPVMMAVDVVNIGVGAMLQWLILAMAAAVTPRARGSRALLVWALAAAAAAVSATYLFGTALEPFVGAMPLAFAALGCAHVAWIARNRGAAVIES